ncbi:MAG TPA: hypothetical protein VHQ47_08600 [Phycisphaerae bacterium]|nr:hypothetical protein [Phycisphaerae bacterium]
MTRSATLLAALLLAAAPTLAAPAPTTAPATISLTIHVQSADPGHAPIPGAAIRTAHDQPSPPTTAADGSLHLSLPASAATGLWFQAQHPGFVTASTSWQPQKSGDRPPTDFTLRLSTGVNVGGKVLDTNGQPVPGAKVVLNISRHNRASDQYDSFNDTLTTNAAGIWLARDVPDTFDSADVACYSFAALDSSFYPLTPMHSLDDIRHWGAALRIDPAPPITLTILTPDQKPAADATLDIGNDWDVSNRFPSLPADAHGHITLGISTDNTRPTLTLPATVKAPGCAPQRISLTAGQKPQTITLKPAAALQVTVVDKAGKPIPSARVFLRNWDSITMFMDLHAKDGKAQWTDGPAPGDGTVHGEVLARDMVGQQDVPLAPGQENTVTLLPRALITARVIDADTKKPVPHFHVTEGIVWKTAQPPTWQDESGDDFDKSLDRPEPGKFQYKPSSAYAGIALKVSADGYLPAIIPPFLVDGTPHDFVVSLKHGQGVSGKALDADGKPLAHLIVYRSTSAHEITDGRLNDWEKSYLPHATTAADGSFSFPAQDEPFDLLVLDDTGFGVVTRKDIKPGEPVTITVQRWGKVEGDVLLGDTHAPEGTQIALRDDPQQNPDLSFLFNLFARTVRTDKTGHFVMDRLLPGEHRLVRFIPGPHARTLDTDATLIQIVSDKTSYARIGGQGVAVTGQVDLTPLHGASFIGSVSITAKSNAKNPLSDNAFLTPDGSFRIDNVPAGTYTLFALCVTPGPINQPQKTLGELRTDITIPAAADKTFDAGKLTLSPG